MEILSCRVVLPAMVMYKNNEGHERGCFVYIDHTNKDVIMVDGEFPEDATELRKAIYDHLVASKRKVITPETPSEGFSKLNPESYMS